MMKRPRTLSATFVRQVSRTGFYGDGRGGHGLSLLVKRMASTGRVSKSWCQRIRLGGKPRNIGLGAFPLVSLAEARESARENARLARAGKHPREHAIPTFAAAAAKVIEIHRPAWTHPRSEQDWEHTFREYAFPVFGHKRVDRITTADVLECLIPIWQAKHSTATKLRGRIGAVMDWAESHGHRSERNPAGKAITAALPAPARAVKSHRALPHAEVADAIARVRASRAWVGTKRCFEFIALTAARSGEARGAVFEEIDFETRTWTVPAGRMKARKEHRVPLSGRAVEVLREAEADTGGGSGLVFPSRSGKPLNDVTLSKLLRELGIAAVPHGFRSSFRDWASERTDVPEAVAEAALAHVAGDQTVVAYARSDLFERRRGLMERWARYLQGGTADVVSLDLGARRA